MVTEGKGASWAPITLGMQSTPEARSKKSPAKAGLRGGEYRHGIAAAQRCYHAGEPKEGPPLLTALSNVGPFRSFNNFGRY